MTKIVETGAEDIAQPDSARNSTSAGGIQADLESYYGSIPSILLLINPANQQILYANQAACDFYGHSLNHLTGLPVSALENISQKQVHSVFRYQPGRKYRAVNLQHRLASGKIRDVEITPSGFQHSTANLLLLTIQDKTHSISSEKRFRENEAKYQVILNQIPGSVISFRPVLNESGEVTDGVIEEFNEYLIQSLGIRQKDLQGKSLLSIFGDANRHTILLLCRQANELYRSKQENIKIKGKPAGIFLRAYRINPSLFILISTDASSMNMADPVNTAAVENLPLLMDFFPGYVVLVEKDGSIAYCNYAVTTYLGINTEKLNGSKLINTIHPDDLALARLAINSRKSIHQVLELEARIRGADWNYRWFLCRVMPVLDENEDLKSYACLMVDLTDRKQAEEALQTSVENTRLIYRTSLDGILICTSSGSILESNIAAASMFGWTEEEMRGLTVQELIFNAGTKYQLVQLRKLNKLLFTGELFGIRKDGTKFPIEAGSTTFLDVNGASRSSIFIRDISQRKMIENSLAERMKELTCLSETGQLLELPGIQTGELFTRVIEGFSQTLPQPENAAARLEYDGQIYTFGQVRPSDQGHLTRDVMIDGIQAGSIAVFYPEDGPLAANNTVRLFEDLLQLLELWLQRHKTEDENRRLSMVVEQSPLAVMITDQKGEVTFVNPAFTTLTGYAENEIYGFQPLNLEHPVLTPDLRQSLLETLQTGSAWHAETTNIRKNGTSYWASLNVVPIYDQAGGLINFVTLMEDISVQKYSQQVIQDALDFNQRVLQVTPLGVAIYDASGRCIQANEAAAQIIGGSVELMLRQNYNTLQSWKTSGIFDAALRAVNSPEPVHIEGNYVSSFGKPLWLSISFVQFNAIGEPHLLMIFEDNTLQKSTEANLKFTNEKLSRLVMDLEKYKLEADLLRQMIEMLQVCQDEQEAFSMVQKFGGLIFPGSSGALYSFGEPGSSLRMCQYWGVEPSSRNELPAEECLSRLGGKAFLYSSQAGGTPCSYMPADFAGSYLDIPLMTENAVTEVLHIEWVNNVEAANDNQASAYIMAENLALSLANIRLHTLLKLQSIRDPLTGAFNRRFMSETLQNEFPRAVRKLQKVGLIMIDIDHFKSFNDRHGHEAGDFILLHLTALLKKLVRSEDVVCRMGGEEFLVIMPDVNLDVTMERAELIRAGMASETLVLNGQVLGMVTVSIGVALFPDHGKDAEIILRRVDSALYSAKNNGRNRVEIASPIRF